MRSPISLAIMSSSFSPRRQGPHSREEIQSGCVTATVTVCHAGIVSLLVSDVRFYRHVTSDTKFWARHHAGAHPVQTRTRREEMSLCDKDQAVAAGRCRRVRVPDATAPADLPSPVTIEVVGAKRSAASRHSRRVASARRTRDVRGGRQTLGAASGSALRIRSATMPGWVATVTSPPANSVPPPVEYVIAASWSASHRKGCRHRSNSQ